VSRRSRRGGGLLAHVLFLAAIVGLVMLALRVGYPNVSVLAAIYALGAATLFEVASRFGHGGVAPGFWRTTRSYALLIGLTSFYLATDAYVLEQAYRSYPAGLGWFVGVLVSVGLLALTMSLRQPERTDLFVLEPRFTGNGIGLFVVAISLQLFVMTGIVPLLFTMVAFRVTCLATALWFVMFGAMLRHWAAITVAGIMVVLNVLTAYLDLLWPHRESWIFLGGAVGVALVTIAALLLWTRSLLKRPRLPTGVS